MWWIVVFVSAGLIALGVALLVRDMLRSRTKQPKLVVGAGKVSAAKAGLSPFARVVAAALPAPVNGGEGAQNAATRLRRADVDDAPTAVPAGAHRLPALEQQWPQLRPEIDAAIAGINHKMVPLGLSIGTPGEATWSLHNQGFGDYRRVLFDRDSVAWLRLEVGGDLRISAKLRAHDAENATINRDCVTPSRRTPAQLSQTLTECLAAVFDFAVWRHSNLVKNDGATVRVPTSPASVVVHATLPNAPLAAAEVLPNVPPALVPSPAAALVDAAIALVNRAFAEADAELVAASSQRGHATAFTDRALSITARGVSVGLMLVEPRTDRIDISVGVSDIANFQAARRQSQPMAGLTLQVLAEAIATNAWPAIAAASQPPAAVA